MAKTSAAPQLDRRRSPVLPRVVKGEYVGLIGGVVGVAVILSFLSPYFLQLSNFVNIGVAFSFTGIVAAITTAVLVSGGLDLSIAGVMALSSTIVAVLLHAGLPWYLAIFGALAAGAAVGVVNGYLISYVGINPFVVTVASQFVVRGAAYVVTGGSTISVTDRVILFLGQGRILGFPLSLFVMVVVFALVGWLMHRSVLGRHWYAIGGSPGGRMARLAGIPVSWRRMQVYILSGVASALAGILLAGYTTVGDANAVFGSELTILGAVILGGTALTGGRGTIVGTLIGVVLLGIIDNGIQLLNLGTAAQYLFQGFILLLAVTFDQVKNRKESP